MKRKTEDERETWMLWLFMAIITGLGVLGLGFKVQA